MSGAAATAEAERAAPFAWGTTVVDSHYDGHAGRQWAPRRHHVAELLLDAARYADRDFLVQGGRRITFADHDRAVDVIAGRLRAAGLGPGRRLLVLSGNHPETVATFWAGLRLGAVVALGNAWWSEDEVAAAAAVVDPALVVADGRRAGRVPAGLARLGLGTLADAFDAAPAPAPAGGGAGAGEHDPAVILFSSGTTGAAKAAVLSHRAVVANVHNLLALGGRLPQDQDPGRPQAVSLLAVPFFHLSGLQAMLLAALTGGRLVFRSDGPFDPGEILDLIERERVSAMGAVPTMLSRILGHPDLAERDLTCLRSVTTGGMPVAPALLDRVRAAFPSARLGTAAIYGLTESGGVLTSIVGADLEERPWSSGRPLPVVELDVHDPDGAGVGEVIARSPTVMSGYLGTADSPVDADGWLHTGDLGRLEDGHLRLVGRAKDVIIRAGENVAAPHVEACLVRHPAVAEAAVVALPHPDLGEEVAAVVVLHPGAEATTAAGLAAHARACLASFEVPSRWWLRLAPLPTNAAGKVRKLDLQRSYPEE